jgi:hypothetical protein
MPAYFSFERDDKYIREHLTPTEINGVVKWQSDALNYEFSFHEQHDLGWPAYIIESGKRGVRDRPKLNLKIPDYVIREGER